MITEEASDIQFQIIKNRERDEFNIAEEIISLRKENAELKEQKRLLIENSERLADAALDEFYSYKANHAVKAHKALMEKINSV